MKLFNQKKIIIFLFLIIFLIISIFSNRIYSQNCSASIFNKNKNTLQFTSTTILTTSHNNDNNKILNNNENELKIHKNNINEKDSNLILSNNEKNNNNSKNKICENNKERFCFIKESNKISEANQENVSFFEIFILYNILLVPPFFILITIIFYNYNIY